MLRGAESVSISFATMRASRLWPRLALGCLLWSVPAVTYSKRFRTGVGIQATLQTSSDALLGGATTTIKPDWSFTGVLLSHVQLTGAFFYKQSIHTTRGIRAKQFEPDVTLNARVLDATWFLEWD